MLSLTKEIMEVGRCQGKLFNLREWPWQGSHVSIGGSPSRHLQEALIKHNRLSGKKETWIGGEVLGKNMGVFEREKEGVYDHIFCIHL